MTATADRAQFVLRATRLSTAPVNATVDAAFGDLARTTDTAPFETGYSALSDVQHARDAADTLLSRDARIIVQTARLTPALLGLDFSTVTPSARAIDSDLSVDRTGLISALPSIKLIAGTVDVETWG
jgi:hypothetical protein